MLTIFLKAPSMPLLHAQISSPASVGNTCCSQSLCATTPKSSRGAATLLAPEAAHAEARPEWRAKQGFSQGRPCVRLFMDLSAPGKGQSYTSGPPVGRFLTWGWPMLLGCYAVGLKSDGIKEAIRSPHDTGLGLPERPTWSVSLGIQT